MFSVYGNKPIMYQIITIHSYPTISTIPSYQMAASLLGHTGVTRLIKTLYSYFWFPQMKSMIMEVVKKMSLLPKVQGQSCHLPSKNVQHLNPQDEVHVDMRGPWKVNMNNFEYQFRAITCIDAIIKLPEVIPVDNARSQTVANAFGDH